MNKSPGINYTMKTKEHTKQLHAKVIAITVTVKAIIRKWKEYGIAVNLPGQAVLKN